MFNCVATGHQSGHCINTDHLKTHHEKFGINTTLTRDQTLSVKGSCYHVLPHCLWFTITGVLQGVSRI